MCTSVTMGSRPSGQLAALQCTRAPQSLDLCHCIVEPACCRSPERDNVDVGTLAGVVIPNRARSDGQLRGPTKCVRKEVVNLEAAPGCGHGASASLALALTQPHCHHETSATTNGGRGICGLEIAVPAWMHEHQVVRRLGAPLR